ncbi:alternative ribosome rescue aminoacyl-tRNA hydrolase ArfB [Glycomyces xiaoerkulensis]|uniref:alternative ribosome rescue aminoacyl-tRNA hydrolase ArfB n=1 Tax=Glycomyces xiaoerkulensis TaxID=2038139 RepID=UPI000C25DCC5
MPVRVTDDILIPDAELTWRFSRSSGPGGQSVNTTDSRVELSFNLRDTKAIPAPLADRALARLDRHLVDGTLTVTSAQFRSQLQNRKAATERLARLLREAVAAPPPKRRATKPSKGAKRRRLEAKRKRSQTKRLRRDLGD